MIRIALTFIEENDSALQFPCRVRPWYIKIVEHFCYVWRCGSVY